MARPNVWTTVAAACIIVTSYVLPASAQTCSLERAAQCRDDVMRQVRQESRSFRGQEITNLCRSVRDNMACLMWHSANCQSRDQQDKSGDVILSAKSFLDRSCDLDGGWRVSRCFQYDDVKQCEANFVAGGKASIVADSCRSYVAFKRCVKDVAGRRCSVEEERQLSSYLVDRARELSWQCGATSGEARDVHSIYRSGSPGGYAPYTQAPAYYPPRYLGTSSTSPPLPLAPLHRYNFSAVSASSPSSRASSSNEDSYCMLRASEYIQDCSREHQRRQYNARRYHSDDRVRETCCATLAYRECIKVVLHDQCRDAGSSVIDNILYQQTRELDYECRDFNAYRCSGCIAKTSAAMLLAAVTLVLVRTLTFGSS
uniref:24 kDa family member n=1 Tax=Rhipicephalus zambeziensis TaxID=60191 RepID=A0A224Z1B5_9ACAR